MKKTFIFILVIVLIFGTFGCEQSATDSDETPAPTETAAIATQETVGKPIKIATLAGPSGMGLVGLINDESGQYSVEVLTQPDQISPKIINDEIDIATIPSNLAAVLYNKIGGGITTVAVTTTGVLYLLSSDETVTSLADADGKTVVITGQGATPEYIFNKVVADNGYDIAVEYMPAHADLSNAMAAGDVTVGMLPEPFVSITLAKNADIKVAADFNAEWQKLFGEDSEIPMTAVVVSDRFLAENPEAVEAFMADYQASVAYVNSDTDAAAEAIAAAGILPVAAIAKNAIPRCGITFISGDACKTMLDQYYGVLFDSNPISIGGEMPGGAFYY